MLYRGILRKTNEGKITIFFPMENEIKAGEIYPCQLTNISGHLEIVVKIDMPITPASKEEVEAWLGFKLPDFK